MDDKYISQDMLDGLSEEGREYVLQHIGNYNSGRYPRGSGEDAYQRHKTETEEFTDTRKKLKAKGLTDDDIRIKLGMTTTQWRDTITRAKSEETQRMYKEVKSQIDRGVSRKELSEKYGVSLSTIDNYANMEASTVNKRRSVHQVASVLTDKVEQVKYLDVSEGVEAQLGISKNNLRAAVADVTASGEYKVEKLWIPQVTNPNRNTTVNVLTKADVDRKDLYLKMDEIRPVDFYFDKSNAHSLQNLQTPKSIDSSRVKVRYAIPEGKPGHGTERDGGTMDGAMFIRPGLKDVNLGKAKYAQVRIAVDGTHYIKGMALYGDEKDFPKGVDIIFNTNKKDHVPMISNDPNVKPVLKPLKGALDSANPFGATLKRQAPLLDDKGNPVVNNKLTNLAKKLGNKGPVYENGIVNIVNEEGDWQEWSKSLSAQFLSKQRPSVIKERLDATLKNVDKDYEDIQKITNPVIKKALLDSYSDELESKQVHLKAAAPKGLQSHVILPVPKMKENEVHAPNYNNGDRVILIRHPHGGTFEIPELIVNNKGAGRKVVGMDSKDAIGIHPKVAAKLSGADFDGDTVLVIPNNSGKFKSSKSLEGLKNFDPSEYADEGKTFKKMTKAYRGNAMGVVSNLITDMTMKGATTEEMTRAIKHSMVVIDAEKHELNYLRSEKENNIKELQKKYQNHKDNIDYSKLTKFDKVYRKQRVVVDPEDLAKTGKIGGGGSTIISRHKQEVTVDGKWVDIVDANGKTKTVVRNRKKAYLTTMLKDAREYLNPNSSEAEYKYVEYVNELKKRKIAVDKEIPTVKMPKRDPKATIIYKDEVNSLMSKHQEALANAPKERQAQLLATKEVNKYIDSLKAGTPEDFKIDKDDLKKYRNQAINGARAKVGAKRKPIIINDDEWDAIQANAISPTKLKELTRHMDDEQLKELAMPRTKATITPMRRNKAIALLNNGYTNAEVANMLGLSPSTISNIKETAS